MKKNLSCTFLCFVLCIASGTLSFSETLTPSSHSETDSTTPQMIQGEVSESSDELDVKELQIQLETVQETISELNRQLKNVDSQLQKKEQENASLKKENASLKKENEKLKEKNKELDSPVYIYSIIFLCAIIAVLLIFIRRPKVHTANRSTYTEDHTKCPYCGWEHDPGEIVCRKCKTKFH